MAIEQLNERRAYGPFLGSSQAKVLGGHMVPHAPSQFEID
jgi:hypothetical protein